VTKKKRFRRTKVGNWGYVAGKRQQMFRAHEKKQKAPTGVTSTGGGRAEQIERTDSASTIPENGGNVK